MSSLLRRNRKGRKHSWQSQNYGEADFPFHTENPTLLSLLLTLREGRMDANPEITPDPIDLIYSEPLFAPADCLRIGMGKRRPHKAKFGAASHRPGPNRRGSKAEDNADAGTDAVLNFGSGIGQFGAKPVGLDAQPNVRRGTQIRAAAGQHCQAIVRSNRGLLRRNDRVERKNLADESLAIKIESLASWPPGVSRAKHRRHHVETHACGVDVGLVQACDVGDHPPPAVKAVVRLHARAR
jgi:hypothetical protein